MSRRALIYAKVLCDLSRVSTPTAPDAHSRSRGCGEVRSAFSLKIGPSLETFLKVSQAQTTRLGAVLGVLNFDWSYDFSQPTYCSRQFEDHRTRDFLCSAKVHHVAMLFQEIELTLPVVTDGEKIDVVGGDLTHFLLIFVFGNDVVHVAYALKVQLALLP